MRTITQTTETIISRSPFLREILYENIANISEVARKIRPEIEKKLMEKVSEESIAVALHRIKKRLKPLPPVSKLLQESKDIGTRSNLTEFVFLDSPDTIKILEEILRKAKIKEGALLCMSMGFLEATVVVDSKLEKDVEKILKNQKKVRKISGLFLVTIKPPEKMTLITPGIYYLVLKALAWEGITVIDAISIGWELSLLFKNEDADRAFSVIKSLSSR